MKIILFSCMTIIAILLLLAIVVPSLFEKSSPIFAQNTTTTTITTTNITAKYNGYKYDNGDRIQNPILYISSRDRRS